MYEHNVFNVIRNLQPSARGEYEITDVNNAYIKEGKLQYDVLDAPWTDAGTFESLHHASQMLMKESTNQPASSLVTKEQLTDMISTFEQKINELKKHL